MSADGQRTKWCRNIAENFNRLSRAHERYRQTDRQTTDRRAADDSEREREFTFANKIGTCIFDLESSYCWQRVWIVLR